MNKWAILNNAGKLVTSALVAFLCWIAIVNSPLWPRVAQAAQEPEHASHNSGEPAKGHAEAGHGSVHEPKPLEHVMDSKDWELFMSFGPEHISLPKIGEFQITKFMILELIAGGILLLI